MQKHFYRGLEDWNYTLYDIILPEPQHEPSLVKLKEIINGIYKKQDNVK